MLKLGLHVTRNSTPAGESLKFILADLSPMQQTCGEIQPEHGRAVDFSHCLILATEIDAVIASAVRSDGLGDVARLRALGDELYGLLIPTTLDRELARVAKTNVERSGGPPFLVLSLPKNLLWLPWELLHDGSAFWCLKYGLGRTINNVGGTPTRTPNDVVSVSIVTDPNGDFRKLYSPERDEAERVQHAIARSGVSVRTTGPILRGRKESPVTRKMLRDLFCDCDLLHFSGHGSHRERNPDASGWECDDGMFSAAYLVSELTAAASVPILVFSSACVVGRIGNWTDDQGNTASFAAALLERGVQFVVGAAWEIEFNRSSEFTTEFYNSLLSESNATSVGAALRAARELNFRESKGRDLLWASYVFYGDPAACIAIYTTIHNHTVDGHRAPIETSRPSAEHGQEISGGRMKYALWIYIFVILTSVVLLGAMVTWWHETPKSTIRITAHDDCSQPPGTSQCCCSKTEHIHDLGTIFPINAKVTISYKTETPNGHCKDDILYIYSSHEDDSGYGMLMDAEEIPERHGHDDVVHTVSVEPPYPFRSVRLVSEKCYLEYSSIDVSYVADTQTVYK